MNKVYVTGLGVVSAIGNNIAENLASLKAGKTGIARAKHFQSKYAHLYDFGEVQLSDIELKKRTQTEGQKGLSRTTLLAYLAFEEAVKNAQLSQEELSNPKTGFISSSTVGGMCHTDDLYHDANLNYPPTEFVEVYAGSAHTNEIVERYNIKGFTSTINTACSSSANAVLLASRLIKAGKLDRAIVGGSDALAKYTVNGFNALMILSDIPCRPFDERRKGLTLGEGAGYLVLESDRVAKTDNILAEVKGYGNANDAYHPSATSPEAFGPRTAMDKALKSADVNPSEIDYVNAHGTGTENNDITEQFAFTQTFKTTPPFNSTKSYTGHTLAAAGAIESIFSILSLRENEMYPSLNCEQPLQDHGLQPLASKTNKLLKLVMSNSFGFGGNCTSLIFSKG